MIPRSIRWRLPLSYMAIAMLATALLGVVLLLIPNPPKEGVGLAP